MLPDDLQRRALAAAMRVALLALAFAALSARPARADVITFDDIDASVGDVALAGLNPYGGFTWENFSAYTSVPGFDGFNNGIASGANGAYSGGEIFGSSDLEPVIGRITSTNLFDFSSVWLGAGYYDGLSLTVSGLAVGASLFTQTVTLNTLGAQLFNFGFTGIDELVFLASVTGTTADPFNCGPVNCTQFTMDDLTFTPASQAPAPVPEPSTLSLLGLGAAALWAKRRRAQSSVRR